ncbi:MAG: hypothetical protein JWM95_5162 [Gemmatimonadetes bacterium]|nr:hypothetical protein [Gemmatimonadota bacterium]
MQSSRPSRFAYDLLLPATFFALVTAAIELAIDAVSVLVRHRIIWVSEDAAWMTPVAYLVVFIAMAVGLGAIRAALGRIAPRTALFRWQAVAVRIFAFASMFSLLLPYEQISRYGAVLLALGCGVQSARVATDASGRGATRARNACLGLLALMGIASVTIRALRAIRERSAVASLPAAPTSAPNVLVLILDTVRRSNLSLHGYARRTTPNLDRRAAESTVFDRAISTAPWTLPSHANLFTGQSDVRTHADWRTPMSAEPATLAETFRSRGYLTGGFVGNLLYTSYESGLTRGFDHYEDHVVSRRTLMLHASPFRTRLAKQLSDDRSWHGIKSALRQFDLSPVRVPGYDGRDGESVTDAFLAWERGRGNRPYFAFLNYFDAHDPYSLPPEYATKFGDGKKPVDEYDCAIGYVDHQVGRVLDSLERRGSLDNTIVLITSDHGEQFGEHRLYTHANSLYLPLLEVPLVIRYPSHVPAGRRIETLVTTRDMAATLLKVAGVDSATAATLPGISLSRYWESATPGTPSLVFAELSKRERVNALAGNSNGPMRSILDERFHYIRSGSGGDELYAYRTDSLELTNLAYQSGSADDIGRLKRTLDSAVNVARRH